MGNPIRPVAPVTSTRQQASFSVVVTEPPKSQAPSPTREGAPLQSREGAPVQSREGAPLQSRDDTTLRETPDARPIAVL